MKSRIISNNKLPYRGRASLHLALPEQRALLNRFLSSIYHSELQTPIKQKAS